MHCLLYLSLLFAIVAVVRPHNSSFSWYICVLLSSLGTRGLPSRCGSVCFIRRSLDERSVTALITTAQLCSVYSVHGLQMPTVLLMFQLKICPTRGWRYFYQTQTTRRPPKRAEKCRFYPWWPWLLMFDPDLQTCPSKESNVFHLNLSQIHSSVPEISAENPVFLSVVTGDIDLWPWPSNSSEQGTKHVFPVYLVQFCSVVTAELSSSRDISFTNKKVTDSAKNSSLHVLTRTHQEMR